MRLARLILAAPLVAACGDLPDPAPTTFAPEFVETPAVPGSGQSHLAVAPDGTVVMSWLEPEADGHALRLALLDGDSWSAPRTVARGDAWFVNWADFPSVVPVSDRLWAAHWLARRPEGGYAYDVEVAISTDGGHTWGAAIMPHTDGTATEHGFVTLFPSHEGVGAVWLDGRNMQGSGAEEDAHGHGEGGMTLRSAVIGADGTLSREHLIDSLTCDCCQTDVAIGPDGPVVAYRDRSEGEIRDIVVTRALETGWSDPVPVLRDGWRIEGCPVNGPAIDAASGTTAVAWFTAANDQPRVLLARSVDGGRSFSEAIPIDIESPTGRVDVVQLGGGDAIVSWLASDPEGAAISVRRVASDGRIGPVRIVSRTAASRPSGFPQMVASGDQLVVSWTEVVEGETRVRTARFRLDSV
ncbi:MAG: hypothetical protein AMJ58_10565 [Gammaproteobacteria bacterium SG8_30]|nr:MAG: hypothetical protein AMJ58_10565 [Gammaproteobacteria bacterium SG8_30]